MDPARAAYENWHEQFGVDHDSDTPWHRLVKQHLNLPRDVTGRRVLEIGCGRGGFSAWLNAQSPRHLVATDYAASAIRKARTVGGHISFEVGDIMRIAHRDRTFDTVISCETIEHVASPRVAVEELARVLKPGGRLFLTTPNYMGPMGLYRGYLRLAGRRFTEEGQPINHFMVLPMTRRLVSGAGLEIESVDAVGHYMPWPGRPPIEIHLSGFRWFALHSFVCGRAP